MLRTLRLTTALLAGLAVPALALAQSTAPATGARPASPPPALTRPAAPVVPAPAAPAAPTAAPSRTAAAPASMGRKIDVNGASEQELAALPGIGPITAKNIVQGRPWDDTTALVSKKAMTQATYDKNKDRFALADINKSSVADMSKTLPGIGDARARKIAEGRPYGKPDDLVSKNVLTDAQYAKIKDMIAY